MHVKDKKLHRSLINATSKMYYNHDWNEDQERQTKKYKYEFRFYDNGPYFYVTDLKTNITYSVSMYSNYGFPIWDARTKEMLNK